MDKTAIFLLTEFIGPRLCFVVDELFGRRIGVKVNLIQNRHELPQNAVLISFGTEVGDIQIPKTLSLENPVGWEKLAAHIPTISCQSFEKRFIWNYDIFGITFCLLTRLEETESKSVDNHGRFESKNSQLISDNLIDIPWIDVWAKSLGLQLQSFGIEINERQFEETVTFDIDNPTAFSHKGWGRNLGGLATDLTSLNWQQANSRLLSVSGLQKDPYDTFENIFHWLDENKTRATFFVWIGNYGPNDKGLNWENNHFRKLIKQISEKYDTGLHPSYRVLENPNQLLIEKERLENLIGKSITKNRFHFLRFRVPQSYLQLVEAGFTDDFSMGYSDSFGFRAGTSLPFHFFDLDKNTKTPMTIHPFALMDSTAYYHFKMNNETWQSSISRFRKLLKPFNGNLGIILHNDLTFNRFKPFQL